MASFFSIPRGYLRYRVAGFATAAREQLGDLDAWRRWSSALKRVFEAADRAWPAINRALDIPVTIEAGNRESGRRGGIGGLFSRRRDR